MVIPQRDHGVRAVESLEVRVESVLCVARPIALKITRLLLYAIRPHLGARVAVVFIDIIPKLKHHRELIIFSERPIHLEMPRVIGGA
jgi:hypothetical protein